MKRINTVRQILETIPGALRQDPLDEAHAGVSQGVEISSLWNNETDGGELSQPASFEDPSEPPAKGNDWFVFDPVIEIGADVDITVPAFGGEEGERIRKSVELHGMDALGWYSPFHVIGVQWGIYIPVSGLAFLIREAFAELPASLDTKARLAFHAILNHELFHFATEYAIAQAELVHKEPWYLPFKENLKQRSTYCIDEEKLANAYMLKAFRTAVPALRIAKKQEALRRFTRLQPDGYKDGWRVKDSDLDEALALLAFRFGENTVKGGNNYWLWLWEGEGEGGYDWSSQFPIRPSIDWRYCPIHLVYDGARLGLPPDWISFLSCLKRVEESNDFTLKLKRMATRIQKDWARTREKLQVTIPSGADLKKWPKDGPDVYSVRVNLAFRAHLRRVTTDHWIAFDIGGHKEMGHG